MRILAFVLAGAVASTGAAAVRELRAVRAHLDSPSVATPIEAHEEPAVAHAPDRPLALTPSSRGGGALPFGGVPSQPVVETVRPDAPHPTVLDSDDSIPDSVDKCPNEPEAYNGLEDIDGCPEPLPANGPVAVPDALTVDISGKPIDVDALANNVGKLRVIADQTRNVWYE